MTHNCPNCAAPLKEGQCKCEYCGTYFYDMVLDMEYPSPIYLYVRTKQGIITLRGIPRIGDFTITSESQYVTSGFGTRLKAFYTERTGELNLTFDCQEFKDVETGKKCLVKIDTRNEEVDGEYAYGSA